MLMVPEHLYRVSGQIIFPDICYGDYGDWGRVELIVDYTVVHGSIYIDQARAFLVSMNDPKKVVDLDSSFFSHIIKVGELSPSNFLFGKIQKHLGL